MKELEAILKEIDEISDGIDPEEVAEVYQEAIGELGTMLK